MEQYTDGLWYAEHDASDGTHYYSVLSILYHGETSYHEVKILVTEEWGKTLILDGDIRSTEFDEAVFHEALVHPAMVAHPNPTTVLIIGGEDGAVLREVLAYASVEKVVVTGIDDEFVDICSEHLPEWSKGSLDHPGVELEFEETADFLRQSDKKFDVIIADLSEFEEDDSPIDLKSDELYRLLASCLASDGIVVVHGIEFDTSDCGDYLAYRATIRSVFPLVRNYTAHVPSFRGETMMMIASNGLDPSKLSPAEIQNRLSERGRNADKDIGVTLQFYDSDAHLRMFSLPKNFKAVFESCKRPNGS